MADTTGAAAGAKAGAKPMNPTMRMIMTGFSMFQKYGPSVESFIASLFADFRGAVPAAASAVPTSAVSFISDLHSAKESGSVTPGTVQELSDKHSMGLSGADVAALAQHVA